MGGIRKLFDYDKEDVRRLYFDEGLGVRSIGEVYGVSKGKVSTYIKKYLGGCLPKVPFLLEHKDEYDINLEG